MKPISTSNLSAVDPGAYRNGLVRLRLITDLTQPVRPPPLAPNAAGSPGIACAQ